jgi:trimethylamine corrinoid protein
MTAKYQVLGEAIEQGDAEAGSQEALRLAESGTPPLDIFSECIEPKLGIIGDQFSRLEIFLPEMISAAKVVKSIQDTLAPFLHADQARETKGRVVIATVFGDLHDIGKDIVKAMLEVNGFEVRDLGVDVKPSDAVAAAVEFDADIIAFSALMLPSLPYVRDAVEMVQVNDKYKGRFKIMVGGGPVSESWANENGADGYGDDANDAVKRALELMS